MKTAAQRAAEVRKSKRRSRTHQRQGQRPNNERRRAFLQNWEGCLIRTVCSTRLPIAKPLLLEEGFRRRAMKTARSLGKFRDCFSGKRAQERGRVTTHNERSQEGRRGLGQNKQTQREVKMWEISERNDTWPEGRQARARTSLASLRSRLQRNRTFSSLRQRCTPGTGTSRALQKDTVNFLHNTLPSKYYTTNFN